MFKNLLLSIAIILVAESHAAVIINIQQVGNDVKATFSGSFNLDVDDRGNSSIGAGNGLWGGGSQNLNSLFFSNTTGSLNAFFWNGTVVGTPPAARWGSGAALSNFTATVDSMTGVDRFWFSWNGSSFDNLIPVFRIAESYVSNTPISGSWTILNTTMEDLRIDNYGSYVYEFGTTTTDTVTVNLIAIPEPSSFAKVLALLACFYCFIKRRKRA
jgi:hypothetical protein